MNPHHDSSGSAPDLPSRDWPTWLIERAARRAPGELAERLHEEWLADLDAQSGPWSRLRFALGCCWATLEIGRDRIAVRAPVTRVATVQGSAIATAGHPLHDGAWLSRRTIVLILIAGLHVALIAVIGSGLGTRIVATLPDRMKGIVITERHPSEPPPPQVGFKPTEFPPVTREWPLPPEIHFPPPLIDSVPPQPRGVGSIEPPPSPPMKRVAGGPGVGFPSAEAFYPSLARTLREEGAAAVQVCVDAQGQLSGEPQIKGSSGYARLDAGALALAKAGSGHYRSATENGQPVSSCFPFRVRFTLR